MRTDYNIIDRIDEATNDEVAGFEEITRRVCNILSEVMEEYLLDIQKINFDLNVLAINEPERAAKIIGAVKGGNGNLEHLAKVTMPLLEKACKDRKHTPKRPPKEILEFISAAYTGICIELASKGYVVITIAHSYEAMVTELDDGTVIPFENRIRKWMYNTSVLKVSREMSRLKKLKGSMEEKAEAIDKWQKTYCPYLNGRVKEWEKDTMAAIGYAKERYADFIDFDLGIGVSGHSMGGAVAYALCQDYDDFKCGINIDGALFGEHDGKVMKKPYLQIDCRGNIELIYRGFVQKEAPAFKSIKDIVVEKF